MKTALLLCLFTGAPSVENGFRRKNAHLLMVGEPGLGKSQLLKGLQHVAPKAVYICGSSSSSAGLTVSLSKDVGSGDFVIEPGAVVLANDGVCLIDEFDKIPQLHDSLLEAMEQQSVSIAKSGTRCNLQARTSLIAAANFNDGSYCRTKSFGQNVCFSPVLLSRFDLVFLLLDERDGKYDIKLANHLLNLRMNKENKTKSTYFSDSRNNLETSITDFAKGAKGMLNAPQIKAIIAHSLRNVTPTLSAAAKHLIKDYYIKNRRAKMTLGTSPPTVRQLESLIRLTEARARADLRTEATEDDALDVIEIFDKSVFDLQLGLQPGTASQKAVPKLTKKAQLSAFAESLSKLSSAKGDSVFTYDELKSLSISVLKSLELDEAINHLNDQGILLIKGSKAYEFTGS